MINEILSTTLGGLGLLFLALKFLDTNMQSLMTGSVRTTIKKHTSNDISAMFWGFVLGLITSAPAVVGCIASSLYSCRSLSHQRTLIMTTWSNLGCWGLFFVVFLNIDLIVLYLIGFTGIAVYLEKPFKWRFYLGCIAAICLMLFAVMLMKSQSGKIADIPWVSAHLSEIQSAYFKSFVIAALLTFLTQSDLVIMLLITNLSHAHVLTVDQAILMLYGVQIGVGMTYLLLMINTKGIMKQIFFLQILFNVLVGVVFTLLLIVEMTTSIPLVKALSQQVASSIWSQMLFIVIFASAIMCILFTIFSEVLSKFILKIFKVSEVYDPARPRYITMEAISDPASALDLFEQELLALLKRLPQNIEYKLLNQDGDPFQVQATLKLHHEQFIAVTKVADELLKELGQQNIAAEISGELFIASDRLQISSALEEGTHSLLQIELPQACSEGIKTLATQINEAQQVLFETTIDAIANRDKEDIEVLLEAISSSKSSIDSIRQAYIKQESISSVHNKVLILTLTSLFERNVWLLQRLIHEYLPKAPLIKSEAPSLLKT